MKLEVSCCGKILRPEIQEGKLKFMAKCPKCRNVIAYKFKKENPIEVTTP